MSNKVLSTVLPDDVEEAGMTRRMWRRRWRPCAAALRVEHRIAHEEKLCERATKGVEEEVVWAETTPRSDNRRAAPTIHDAVGQESQSWWVRLTRGGCRSGMAMRH